MEWYWGCHLMGGRVPGNSYPPLQHHPSPTPLPHQALPGITIAGRGITQLNLPHVSCIKICLAHHLFNCWSSSCLCKYSFYIILSSSILIFSSSTVSLYMFFRTHNPLFVFFPGSTWLKLLWYHYYFLFMHSNLSACSLKQLWCIIFNFFSDCELWLRNMNVSIFYFIYFYFTCVVWYLSSQSVSL